MNAYVTSIIRTFVPIVVGTIAAYLVAHGLPDVDEAAVEGWLTPVLIGAYYAAIRGAEKKWPQIGWLLGKAAQVVYAAPDATVVAVPDGGKAIVPANTFEQVVRVLDTSTPAKHDAKEN